MPVNRRSSNNSVVINQLDAPAHFDFDIRKKLQEGPIWEHFEAHHSRAFLAPDEEIRDCCDELI